MNPVTGPNQQSPPDRSQQDALALLKEIQDQKIQAELVNEDRDNKQWQYFQQCHRGHPAIFFTKNPRGNSVSAADWFASYKKAGEPWRGDVLCQICTTFDKDGLVVDEYPIKVESYNGSKRNATVFAADPRFLYRYPKDKARRQEVKPHRSTPLLVNASNYGVPNPDFKRSLREANEIEKVKEREAHEKALQELNRG